MKIKSLVLFGFLLFFSLFIFTFNFVLAEDRSAPGGIIPKLQKTPNDPELFNNFVYPEWGPVCQRYTYTVTYRDKEGRPPEYMRIIFNGKPIDMDPAFDKSSAGKKNYQKGVRYEYKFVPNKIGANFYYFEASNRLGKARASIIDSPDNGPVLFESDFSKNEIVLIEARSGSVVWRYPTGKEWVGGVALSADSQYLTALTSRHVYLFSPKSDKPLWQYEFGSSPLTAGGPKGNGIAISADGSRIIAASAMEVVLFSQEKNQPLWKYPAPALAVTISADGQYQAAAILKDGKNAVLLWRNDNDQPIQEFTASGNFHDVSLSDNGQYLVASTGCPDRKAYIFSKDKSQPLIKSDSLTFDSPVSKAKISADGSLAAFATEGGPDSSVVVLFNKDSSTPLWKFDNQKRNSSRAMSMTTDGRFIGAATMMGDVYLLSSEDNTPLKTWALNTSVGALDIADDGSLIAVGGTDKQVQILPVSGDSKKIPVNEFVQTIDIADNGQYLTAGTGGSVYFCEDYISPTKEKVFDCSTIIEPSPIEIAMRNYQSSERQESGGLFEKKAGRKSALPILIEGLALAGILIVTYGLLNFFAEKITLCHPVLVVITLPTAVMLWGINHYQFNFQMITDFCALAFSLWTILLLVSLAISIPRIFWIVAALFFSALGTITLTSYQPFFSFPTLVHLLEAIFGFGYLSSLFKDRKKVFFLATVVVILFTAHLGYQFWGSRFSPVGLEPESKQERLFPNQGQGAIKGKIVCGNNLCEPDSGETKENCPQDCSAGD